MVAGVGLQLCTVTVRPRRSVLVSVKPGLQRDIRAVGSHIAEGAAWDHPAMPERDRFAVDCQASGVQADQIAIEKPCRLFC